MTVAAHIAVRWPKKARHASADHDCVVGREIKINAGVLQDFSATLLTSVEQDLVLVAGAVAYADRIVRRHRAGGWARDLQLTVPVSLPHIWKQPAIIGSLIDALEYVTGDRWKFSFVAGAQPMTIAQSSLDFTRGNYVVVPFSDGLDSYLQWQLLKVEEPNASILRVHTSSSSTDRARNRKIDGAGDQFDHRLSLPVSLSVPDHPEPTYRSRTFLFYAIAALAAFKFGTQRVVIGESGSGALGPCMVPFGDECPHRTTHPEFTRLLAVFLNRLLEAKIVFEHPQLLRTKGQVLERAVSLGVQGWQATHSCARGKRDRLSRLACGVCGGCLLRRTALASAGLADGAYFWNDLSGETLDDCRSVPTGRASTKNDKDIAIHGVFDMSALADLGTLEPTAAVFDRAAWQLAGYTHAGQPVAAADIARLARRHAEEWSAFGTRFANDGFLNTRKRRSVDYGTP